MSQPLRITFATDTENAKRSVNSLTASIVGNMATVNAAMADGAAGTNRFQSGMENLGGPARGLLDVLIGFEAVKTVFSEVGKEFDNVAGKFERMVVLAQKARDVGVGPSFFQGFVGQAGALGTTADRLEAMLAKAREVSTTRIGEGNDAVNESAFETRARRHVEAGNLSADDLAPFRNAQDTTAKIRAVLDLVEKLRDDGRELAGLDLGKTMFGDDFERKIRDGVDAIGAMRKAMDGMDVAGGKRIVSDEEIASAERLNALYKETQDTLARGVKPISEDITAIQLRGQESWQGFQLAVAQWIETNVTPAYMKLRNIVLEMIGLARQWGLLSTPAGAGEGGEGAFNEANPLRIKPRAPRDRSNPLPGKKSAGTSSSEVDSVEAYIRQLEKADALAQAELANLGKSNVEREKAVALAKAEAAAKEDVARGRRKDAALDDDERRRVLAAAEAEQKVKDKVMDLKQSMASTAETARYFGNTLSDAMSDAIVEGKSFQDILTGIEKQLAKSAIKALITGEGPLAGLLGTAPAASSGPNALGGLLGTVGGLFRANGGEVQPGQGYTVGEVGREIFVPNQAGRMVPIASGGAGLGGGAPVTNIHNYAGTQVSAETTRDASGWMTDVHIRPLENALMGRATRGQGPLSSIAGGAAWRRG